MTDAYDLDEIRQMVGYVDDPSGDCVLLGAQDIFTPASETYVRVTTTGATLNDYDEPVGGTTTEEEFKGHEVPITDRLKETMVGDWSEIMLVVRTSYASLRRGDQVRRVGVPDTTYKVLRIETPQLGGKTVCYNVQLGRVHT